MKICKKDILLYILIVFLPALSATSMFAMNKYLNEKNKVAAEAQWVASVHQKQMDQLIGEAATSLEMLAITIESNFNRPEDIRTTLEKMSSKDPRYSGIYFLDPSGEVLVGTNEAVRTYRLESKKYIQTMKKAHLTVVSDESETLTNGQKVIPIASPVLKDGDLIGILTAHLRIDYLKNIMAMLTPDANLRIDSGGSKPIIELNSQGRTINHKEKWITQPLERVPWDVAVEVDYPNFLEKIILSTLLFFIISASLLHVVFLFLHNITLKRQAERDRAQNESQKLELVGTLAAGIAHEIRNPLTGIKGLVQLLSEKYRDSKDQFYFSVINKEIARINQIVSEFLILGKPTVQKNEWMDVKAVLFELTPLIQSEANLYNVQVSFRFNVHSAIVFGSKDQMKQVVLNLTKNAFESMETGGALKIDLSRDGKQAVLTIADTGVGISAKEIEHIFTPFYTSKEHGTGLGLVVCKRIIQSFGGSIDIVSKENQGTTVTIILQAASHTKEDAPTD